MRHRVVSDFRLAGIVCHLICLIIFVADRIPSASSATAEVSSLVASGGKRPLLDDASSPSSSSVSKSRSIRAAVLPLGHRYIGLGKRLLLTAASQGARGGVGGVGDNDKRPSYSHPDGAAMRFIGLGKRAGPRVVDSGLRFIGLGKRNSAAMRYIGLGKRNSAAMRYIGLGKRPFYDSDAEEEQEEQDMDEVEEKGQEDEEEDVEEDRRKRIVEKRSTEGRRHTLIAEPHFEPFSRLHKN